MKNVDLREKCEKCGKIKKDSKNHKKKNIDPTDLWLAPFERKKISSFLAVNIKKCIIPGGKWPNFLKCPQSKMENPISPLRFKKSNYVI